MEHVATLVPLIVGSSVVACTIVIHGAALLASLHLVRRELTLGRVGTAFWIDLRIVVISVLITLVAHLIAIAAWAVSFILVGEFDGLGPAFYHSAVNYTTLGYGDIVMSPAWKMLGPLEAMDGLLMFGLSTATIFAVIHRMVQTRFPDLRSDAARGDR